ncbi:hypothetical protein EPR50_G00013420 [Xyrichtys novacula]|uniref:Uncharacterized protein n=1 Tax=Xyrichtys novacula TaxID=13765 RepID=A0AAV1EVF7_XYRNO|nr:hypothetical protein EPR50_G00013420 [Xyrichtys novacula]
MSNHRQEQGSCAKGPFSSHHGWTRCRVSAPVHWDRQVLQRLHNHRKEELCLAYVRQHSNHCSFLQIETQETGGCHRKVIMCQFWPCLIAGSGESDWICL